jgi:hypothetical protein
MSKTKLAVTLTTALLAGDLAAMDRYRTRQELAQLAPVEKAEPAMSAMCYDMAVEPLHREYTCPTCGEKTLFAEGAPGVDEMELTTLRRLLRQMPQRKRLTLDESSLCRKCRPKAEKRELVLSLRYDDGKTESVHGVTSGDLALLAAVLEGRTPADAAEVKQSSLGNLVRLGELAPPPKP